MDANLAILLAVGLVGREHIIRHKRLDGFGPADFDLLRTLVGQAAVVVFTPNVLTETSNLSRQVAEPLRSRVAESLARIIAVSEERFVSSRLAVRRRDYARLGLTDAVLLDLSASGGTLLTTDLDLYLAASRAGYGVWNFHHVSAAQRGSA